MTGGAGSTRLFAKMFDIRHPRLQYSHFIIMGGSQMKKMIVVCMVLLCAVSISSVAFSAGVNLAGPNWLYDTRGEDTLSTFWQYILGLDVTKAQKAQIKPLYNKQQQTASEIRKNSSLSARDRQTKINALNSEIHQRVLEALTKAQREKLKRMPGFQP